MKKSFITKSLIALMLVASLGACKDIDALPKNPTELEDLVKKAQEVEKKKEQESDKDKPKDKKEQAQEEKDKKEGEKPQEGNKDKEAEKQEENQDSQEGNKDNNEDKPQEEQTEPEKEDENQTEPQEEEEEEGELQLGTLAEPMKLNPVVHIGFTGQRCDHCPESKRIKERFQKRYGKDKYLYVSLHSREDYSPKFYNEEAKQYRSSIENETGLPGGGYNRLGKKFHHLFDLSLNEMFETPDLLECKGNAHIISEKEIEVNLKSRLRKDQVEFIKGKKLNMLIWILENGVIAYQADAGDSQYYTYPEHKHIFRSSLNGHWGKPLKFDYEYRLRFPVPTNVAKVENCEIMVLFLDRNTKVVFDAASFDIKKQ